ncbi:short-chain dehydrogenases/reductase [Penicillium verhagenii]|nr:short-chain dehydrogenases/reductase [Penicillium verhagenii]
MAHTLAQVRTWNAALKTTRPDLVALFVGATSGIGRNTAVRLAASVDRPTIFTIGRNEAAGAEVLEELKAANKNGTYKFFPVDVSHLRNVDEVCHKLKPEIQELDLLFLSSGAPSFGKKEGDDNIDVNHIIRYYSRLRFVHNLLPSLELSKSPRVVSVLAGGQEMMIEEDNLDLKKRFSFSAGNGYPTTMTTLAFEHLASKHPSVSFIHDFPGIVATPLFKKVAGPILGSILGFLSKVVSIPASESGEWHTYLATAPEYKSKNAAGEPSGGSYILNHDGKDVTNQKLMEQFREKDFPSVVWKHTLDTFEKLSA